jgi:hypothetical protein
MVNRVLHSSLLDPAQTQQETVFSIVASKAKFSQNQKTLVPPKRLNFSFANPGWFSTTIPGFQKLE